MSTTATSAQPHTTEFYNLIRSIGETKSKQEEDKIIVREIATLKQHFDNVRKNPNQSKHLREYLIRMLYCELLGHQASFGYFFAVTATSSLKLVDKRMGYLATSLCLPKDHELVLLLTHNMQKDLKSSNQLEIASALSAASKIITEETIPALLPKVIELTTHHFPMVRKKAFMFIHSAYSWYPDLVANPLQHVRDGFRDRDPSVMGASLCLLHEVVQKNPTDEECKLFVDSLVGILHQIVEHRLSSSYDYHRLPAPWIQMKILTILAILGRDDPASSELMYDVLKEVMRRADIGLNIGHAVVFECIRTISSIYPSNELLEIAASATARFMQSRNHNLKYLGIQALTTINNPKYANQHQATVIDCLEDKDETLKRTTLSLLFTMTNENNVTIITNKLMEFARKELDKPFQEELISKICSLAEKFAPDNFWYIDTINDCFEVDASLVPAEVINTMIAVVAEGTGDDLSKDEELRAYSVDIFFELLQEKSVIHDVHVQVISWILGEYGYLSKKYTKKDIIGALCDVAERRLEDNYTRCWIFSALLKLMAQTGERQPQAEEIVWRYLNSRNVDLQQRCYEFISLVKMDNIALLKEILPLDGSCEEVPVDEALQFLNGFVRRALEEGAQPYLGEDERDFEHIEFEKPQLKIEHEPVTHSLPIFSNPNLNPTDDTELAPKSAAAETGDLDPGLFSNNRKRVWFDDDDEPTEDPFVQQQFAVPFSGAPTGAPANVLGGGTLQGFSSGDFTNGASLTTASGGIGSSTYNDNTYNPPPTKTIYEDDIKKPSKKTTEFVSAIFGGDSAGDSKKTGVRGRKPAKSGPSASVKKSPPKSEAEPSLLMMDDPFTNSPSTSLKQTEVPQERSAPQQGAFLSLDDLLGDSSSASVNETPKQVSNNSGTAGGLFSNMNAHTQPAPPTPVDDFFGETLMSQEKQPQQQGGNLFDDDFMSPISTNSTANTVNNKFSLNMTSMSPTNSQSTGGGVLSPSRCPLVQRLRQLYTPVPAQPESICSDGFLSISEQRFRTEDSIVIALTFKTERGYQLTNITVELQPPAKYAMEFQTSHDPSMTTMRTNTVTFKTLEPASPIVLLLKMSVTDVGFGSGLMGMISYSDNQKKRRSNTINLKLGVLDLLRPHAIDVQAFGKQWQSHTREKRVVIKHQGITIEKLKTLIQTRMNVHVIQTIDTELIASGRLINLDLLVLVHANVVSTNSTIVFTARSTDTATSASLASTAQKKLVETQ